MTLRRRLIVTMVVLVAIGLAALDVITLDSLHSYLYGRVDDQLRNAAAVVQHYILRTEQLGRPINPELVQARTSPEIYLEILDNQGGVVLSLPSGSDSHPDPAPQLPPRLPVSPSESRNELARRHGAYHPNADSVNVPSVTKGGPEYRVQASSLPGGTLVVATSLDSVNATLTSLRRVVIGVSVAVVVALCVLMALVIRRGLRPLEDMSAEADLIAAGDLTRRVEPADAGTEIGRLGRALNRMLSQIEAAFAQQTMSEERLRQFLADASHELRTPLTSIRGYAELLGKDAFTDSDSRERALARIESEAARMGVLVADLLALARLGEQPELPHERVDLGAVARDVVADARTVDASHPIAFEAADPVYVWGDEQRVWQIVHNLLGNATMHTPAGTPVEVRVSAEGDRAVLQVMDQGPGMGVEQASRAFDRFFRGDATRSGGGSGLGLFIVAATARALGGHVAVDTALGRGATFQVVLPLYRTDRPHLGSEGAARRQATPPADQPIAPPPATGWAGVTPRPAGQINRLGGRSSGRPGHPPRP